MRKTLLAAVAILFAPTLLHADQHRNPNGSNSDDVYINAGGQLVGPSNPLPTGDAGNAAFGGVIPLSIGVPATAGRSVAATCTASGNISLTFADASTLVIPVVTGFQTFPFAITQVNAGGTTATCAFVNLK